jgi:glycosyltransferase involved in cell wall biosynthesis
VIVGVDARAASEVPAGRGRVVRELLVTLNSLRTDHRFLLYCRTPWEQGRLGSAFEWVSVPARDPLWHSLTALRANHRCEVFLSTNSYLTAALLRIPSAVLMYDLIAFVPGARAQRRAARIERATIRPAVRRARRLICISQATEDDLLTRFPRATGKTAVVPLAADSRFGRERPDEELVAAAARHRVSPGGFVLAAGTLEPRKNLPRLIAAHARLPRELRAAYPLLVVGPPGWELEEALPAARSPDVTVTGFVPDEELAALYAGCSVFCYPSLYEGFGLPVLEAMQSGAPTITSSVSSLPEVGGDAVMYVDPRDESAIQGALERLLCSPAERTDLAERGRRRAREFSWDRTTRGVLEQLELAHAACARRSSTRS